MADDGVGQPSCQETGLTVPECSCGNCLRAMLQEFSPHLLDGEITITRLPRDDPSEQREAA